MFYVSRGSQAKALLAQRFTSTIVSDSPTQKTAQPKSLSKPRPKQQKAKAEPPPKKRRKWKEEFATSPCSSSPEAVSEDDGETLNVIMYSFVDHGSYYITPVSHLFTCLSFLLFPHSHPPPTFLFSEFIPPVPFASRFLNTRTMKETFKSFVELLISVALNADVMNSLERENGDQTVLYTSCVYLK